MSESDWIYLLFCAIFSFCFIFNEFASAGISVDNLFTNFLGDEYSRFIQYHIMRVLVTLLVHSFLPLIFLLLRYLSVEDLEMGESLTFQVSIAFSLMIPTAAMTLIYYWYTNDWKNHPIARGIQSYANNNIDWKTVATDINTEYRSQNRMEIKLNSISSLIITENWIIKTMPYHIYIAHQTDTELIADKADSHAINEHGVDIVQYVNIQVKPLRRHTLPFEIRIKATQFKDIQDRLSRQVVILPSVRLQPSLLERWNVAFEEQVRANPRYFYNGDGLESCFACFAMEPNIKIWKNCLDTDVNGEELPEEERCGNCYCRPMWCMQCLARWFSARQDEGPETWLEKKSPCPMCRTRFCIRDVCFIAKQQNPQQS